MGWELRDEFRAEKVNSNAGWLAEGVIGNKFVECINWLKI